MIGEDISLDVRLAAAPAVRARRHGADGTGAGEPGGQRARRHAQGRRLAIATSALRLVAAPRRMTTVSTPAPTCSCGSPTPASACRPRSPPASSSRSSPPRAPEGTGLGLATVYGIVRQAGGAVCGTLAARRRRRVLDRASRRCSRRRPPWRSRARVARRARVETILVVEDEPQVRAIAVNMLRRARVSRAGGGHEPGGAGAGAARSMPIDLVVTDVVMPNGSGPELVTKLRADHPDDAGPVRERVCPGYAAWTTCRRDTAFLQKPYTGRQLAMRIREVLDGAARPSRATRGGRRGDGRTRIGARPPGSTRCSRARSSTPSRRRTSTTWRRWPRRSPARPPRCVAFVDDTRWWVKARVGDVPRCWTAQAVLCHAAFARGEPLIVERPGRPTIPAGDAGSRARRPVLRGAAARGRRRAAARRAVRRRPDSPRAGVRPLSALSRIARQLVRLLSFRRHAALLAEAHEALAIGEAQYRLLADTAPDAIITVDDGGRIMFANPAIGAACSAIRQRRWWASRSRCLRRRTSGSATSRRSRSTARRAQARCRSRRPG